MFKSSKIRNLLTLALSLLGVLAAGISTFAWFQITEQGTNVTKTATVTSGSSGLTINSVTGYKYVYDDLDADTVDYYDGHVTAYGDSTKNMNQGKVTDFDVPSSGLGYYIVGDETFCRNQGFDEKNKWKYAGGLAMVDDPEGKDKAIATNIFLSTGSEFKIRHHYIDGSNTVHDDWCLTSDLNTDATTTSLAKTQNGNFTIKGTADGLAKDQTGYFSLYWTSGDKLSIKRTGDPIVHEDAPGIRIESDNFKPTRKNAIGKLTPLSNRVYLKIDSTLSNWCDDNAKFAGYFFYDNEHNAWSDLSVFDSELNCYPIDIPDKQNNTDWTKVIFVRLNPADLTSATWDNKWDQTGDLTLTNNIGKSFLINNSGGGFTDLNWQNEYPADGWYILGTGGNVGGVAITWDAGVKLGAGNTDNHAILEDVAFDSNVSFKVVEVENGAKTTWWGYGGVGTDLSYTTNDTSALKGWESGGNIQTNRSFTATVYASSKDTKVWIDVNAYNIQLKYKRYYDGSFDSAIDSSWQTYDYTATVKTGLQLTLPTPLLTNYDTWTGWYDKEDFDTSLDTAITTITSGTKTHTLYAKCQEISFSVYMRIAYTTAAENSVTKDEFVGSAYALTGQSRHTPTTVSALDGVTPGTAPDTEHYAFVGYYRTLSSSTFSDRIDTSYQFSEPVTAESPIYKVYRPKGPVTVHLHKQYFARTGTSGSYTFTTVSSKFADITLSNTTWGSLNYAAPTGDEVRGHGVSGFNTTDEAQARIFHLDSWYEGASGSVTYDNEHKYSTKQLTSETYLWARYYYDESVDTYMTLHVDTGEDGIGWTTPCVGVFNNVLDINTGDTLFALQKNYADTTRDFKFIMPTTANYKFGISNSSAWPNDKSYQTIDIALSDNDKNGTARGSMDFCIVDTEQDSSDSYKRKFTWNNYYNNPTGYSTGDTSKDGYYLVGNASFSGGAAWSYGASTVMSQISSSAEIGTEERNEYEMGFRYKVEEITLSYGMEFQLWHFANAAGTTVYYTLETDAQTSAIASVVNRKITIASGVTGNSFNIYFDEHDKISIVDTETATEIFFDNNLSEYDTNKFVMGTGNSQNLAIYEQGLHITSEDLTSSFVVRRKSGGIYTWYAYDSSAANHGTYNSTSDALVQQGTSATYGAGVTATKTGFKFKDVGYYNIYVMSDGTLRIFPIPGDYGEGYYIIPYNGSTTDSWTGGIKMKEINHSGVANKALYTCYNVSSAVASTGIYIRSFTSGVDHGLITHINDDAPSEGNPKTRSYVTDACHSGTSLTSPYLIKFKEPGAYNIYIYESGGTEYVSIAEYSSANFFTMNQISSECTTPAKVKDYHTSIVFEVDFTTTHTGFNVNANLSMVSAGSGISQYLKFTHAVVTSLGDYDNCYEYMREEEYSNLSATKDQTDSTSLSAGNHKLYILVDYDPSKVGTIPFSSLSNDFYFVLKARQVAS